MKTYYLLFLAKYTQNWGGYLYEKGTPRGMAVYVRGPSDLAACLLVWFGTSVDVHVDTDAYYYWRKADVVFETEAALVERLPPHLQQSSSPYGIWTFDDRAVTPALLVEDLAPRVRNGRSARREERELPPPPKREYSQIIKDYFGLPGARPR
jgi:hypothetical protein